MELMALVSECKRLGIRQVDIAERCGCTQQAVSAWLSGQRRMKLETKLQITRLIRERLKREASEN